MIEDATGAIDLNGSMAAACISSVRQGLVNTALPGVFMHHLVEHRLTLPEHGMRCPSLSSSFRKVTIAPFVMPSLRSK